jgi:hypothetical protein
VGDLAAELGSVLLRLLREATPPPVVPSRWRRIEAEAVARGFSSTRALREWCLRHGVTPREDSHRDTWVQPAEIDAAVERLPAVLPTARQLGPRAVDAETEADARESLGLPR